MLTEGVLMFRVPLTIVLLDASMSVYSFRGKLAVLAVANHARSA